MAQPSRRKAASGESSLVALTLGRLRWSMRGLLPVTSPVVMAQAFAYLFGVGATLTLVTLFLPHDPDRFVPGIVGAAAIAAAVAAVMLIGFERLPIRSFYLLPGLGAAIVTVVVYSGGANAAAAYGGYYFWAVLAAFFFLDFWRAVPTLAIAVVGYGVALVAQGDAADPALNWVMAAGTLTVAGVLISLLRQRSERLVELLGEAQGVAHIGSWEWHVPSDEVAWSRELYRLYGLKPGGFPADYAGLLSYVHPEDRDAVDSTIRKALVDHSPFSFEHRVVRHDGATRVVHGRGQVETDDSGDPVRVFGTAQDVTDQRRTQEQFRQLVESAPDAMVIVNEQGRIVLVNAQAEKLFSYAREELVGREVEALVPERFRNSHPGHRRNYFLDPETRAMGAGLDLWGLKKDGTEFPVEISLSPLSTDEGILVSSAIRDITERKRADVLERSFVPERLPEIPGLRLAARFEPGGAGVEVGGDWYDVLELDRREHRSRDRRRRRARRSGGGGHGPAPQRAARIRLRAAPAGRRARAPEQARLDPRPQRDGHRHLPRLRSELGRSYASPTPAICHRCWPTWMGPRCIWRRDDRCPSGSGGRRRIPTPSIGSPRARRCCSTRTG